VKFWSYSEIVNRATSSGWFRYAKTATVIDAFRWLRLPETRFQNKLVAIP